jgi:DNA-binding SARP family transcriptional activator
MQFRILGPLDVADGKRQVLLQGPSQRALLALLLLRANEVVSSDRLLDELWGSAVPASGVTALRVRVSQLRKALGPAAERLETRPPGYVLRVEPGELDLDRFTALLAEAESAEPAVAAERLREALALWRGAPLADLAYQQWAQQAIPRLEELRLAAVEGRLEADLALGRHVEIVGELEELVAEQPLRERLRGQLMLALYRSGRQAESLEVYRATRKTLVEGLGIEPSPGLQQLERAILRQDPELDVAPGERLPGGAPPAVPAPERSMLIVPLAAENLEPLLELAAPLGRRPPHELILASVVTAELELAAAARRVEEQRVRLRSEGAAVRAAAFTSGYRAEDIVRLTSKEDIDLLLLDAPSELADEGKLSGEIAALLERAPCDVGVLVVRGGQASAPGATRPVLVPFGGADNDWAAVQLAAWIAVSHHAPLRLLGTTTGSRRGRRDASRLLATVSLLVQQVAGVAAEPLLVKPGAEAVIEAAAESGLLVVGLSETWRAEGVGAARRAIVREARPPTLLVRVGLRPGGLAPNESLTRFSWSLTSRGV